MSTPDSHSSNGTSSSATESTAARSTVLHRLYTGTGAFDIVGKRKRWYIALGLLVLVCVASIGFKGFNLGIEFTGGTKVSMPAAGAQGQITADEAEEAFRDALGHPADSVQLVGSGDSRTIQIRTDKLSVDELTTLKQGLVEDLQPLGTNGQPTVDAISDSAVSGTWGGEITQQALIALGVFLALVAVFLAFYFERWMAVAALIALLHDVVVTAGIYSLIGFEVSPSTVIGLLTILGFSLYDTVVVFDKVKENTRGILGLTRRTYPEAANLALNQTLMRSINTTVIALLPVLGLLIIGAGVLGVGVLRDLALVQGIGMLAGVVSSILLATPLLVDFKMRNPKYRAQAGKVRQRRARRSAETSSDAERAAADTEEPLDESVDAVSRRERTMAAAISASARTGKGPAERGSGGRPSGKSGHPTGKKRR
ncbi:preprotein translocase subunit SecF [Halopolyspora algeriensis]|uniref:Protein-export membrane protein SecF n=1 Tax=Halopolyspora algeriensis TaxID=1500506 RepID=A0A368VS10_9ACTN|nr:protein translocase subunit SecF [Halopolyspora algeriensis]RCW43905.1 preprotein translocase subunit SecF [Halopolyspora algeriensis]TQM53592.1 preprotein translocase subunit SecF [Halopolyspora algeriensis]